MRADAVQQRASSSTSLWFSPPAGSSSSSSLGPPISARRQFDALLRSRTAGCRRGASATVVQVQQIEQVACRRCACLALSSRRTTGRRSALAMKPELPRWCAPTSMLSRTLRLRNNATF